MAVVIKSMSDLNKGIMEKYMASAMKKTQEEIYKILYDTIVDYYQDYTPEQYERTYKFLKSLIHSDIKINGGSVECEVGLDRSYLSYEYPNYEWFSSAVTGQQVAEWASEGLHGGYIQGEAEFWMDNYDLFYKFLDIFKTNLEIRGFKVS